MDDLSSYIFPVAIFTFFALMFYWGYRWEKKRREGFERLAAQFGFAYQPEKDASLALRFSFLNALNQGSNRYACNRLEGQYRGQDVMVFDYHYETHSSDSKGRRQTHHHFFSYFVLFLPRNFPELRIYPEHLFSRIGQMLGFEDIDFESVEFSRAFTVRAKDRKFAYDVCHPKMMELLLKDRHVSLEIEEDCLALGCSTRLDPARIPEKLEQLLEIRQLLPRYLFDA
jgi:hypothetical protein